MRGHVCGAALAALLWLVDGTAFAGPPQFGWIKHLGTEHHEYGLAAATDSAGNAVIAGLTSGALVGTFRGVSDAFLVKYDSSGTRLWKRQIGTTLEDEATGLATDSIDNVIVAGDTCGSLAGTSKGICDGFVYKYSPSGQVIWRRQFGTDQGDQVNGVAVDGSDNIVVTGMTYGAFKGFVAHPQGSAYIVKYSPTGTVLWRKQVQAADSSMAKAIAINETGEIFIAGSYYNSSTNRDSFVAKFTAAGALAWSQRFGTSRWDEAQGLAVDPSGNAIVTGRTAGSLAATNVGGVFDVFVSKFTRSGEALWTRQRGTDVYDEGLAATSDAAGNIFIGGYTEGTLGAASSGGRDGLLIKMTSDGNTVWTAQFGTTGDERVSGIALDPTGAILLAGVTDGTFDGGDFGGPNQGYADAYLGKSIEIP